MNFDDFYKVDRIDEPLRDILGATRRYLGIKAEDSKESNEQRNILNEFRIKNKLTFKEIADKRNISTATVQESCAGKLIRPYNLIKYAEAFGFTIEEFMTVPEYKGKRIIDEENQREQIINLSKLQRCDLSKVDISKMRGKSFEEGLNILIEQLKKHEDKQNNDSKLSKEEYDRAVEIAYKKHKSE